MKNEMPYVIVRTYTAGVFAGYLESRNGREGIVRDSRRIWSWEGAASLSQLAEEGTKAPEKCKFAMTVGKTELLEIIEILHCSEQARLSIEGVPVWESKTNSEPGPVSGAGSGDDFGFGFGSASGAGKSDGSGFGCGTGCGSGTGSGEG